MDCISWPMGSRFKSPHRGVSSEYTSTLIQIFPIFRQIFKNTQTHQKCRRPEADLPLPTSMLNFDPGSVGSSMVVVGKMVDFWWISAVFGHGSWLRPPTQLRWSEVVNFPEVTRHFSEVRQHNTTWTFPEVIGHFTSRNFPPKIIKSGTGPAGLARTQLPNLVMRLVYSWNSKIK